MLKKFDSKVQNDILLAVSEKEADPRVAGVEVARPYLIHTSFRLFQLDSKMKDLVEKAELDESEKPPKSPKSPKSPKTPKGKILKNREVTNVGECTEVGVVGGGLLVHMIIYASNSNFSNTHCSNYHFLHRVEYARAERHC